MGSKEDLNVSILSCGAALPAKIVTNDDLGKLVDTSDEWIYTHTGIRNRRIASGDETVTSMAIDASRDAIEKAGISAEEIDLVICSSLSPDMRFPAAAGSVRHALGMRDVPAFDLCGTACAGFIYGVITAESLMKNCGYKTALVVGSEVLSKITDWTDRSSCIIFADGAGAAILQVDGDKNRKGIIAGCLHGFNDKASVLNCNQPIGDSPFCDEEKSPKNYKMEMHGHKVFPFGVNSVIGGVRECLEASGLTADDIKWIVPHQANARIVTSAADRLKISQDKFYVNLENIGNTSSASIPIALSELDEKGLLDRGDKIICIGFGAGLSSGSFLIEW